MHKHLFHKININLEQTHLPNGLAKDPVKECKEYEALIDTLGGQDLQLLGIGHNGHIGFNEPADFMEKATHVIGLAASTIEANKIYFASAEDVPKQAFSMGIGSIMKAKKILLVASGEAKADIVARAFTGPITPQVPASLLQLHRDVTVVGDEAVFSKLPKVLLK